MSLNQNIFLDSKNLIVATLLSLVYILGLNHYFGLYFLEDEVFANYFLYQNSIYNIEHLFFHEEYFPVHYLIKFIQNYCQKISVLGIYKFISLWVISGSIFYIIIDKLKNLWLSTPLILSFAMLFVESFVLINNVKLAFLLSSVAVIFLFQQRKLNRKYLIIYYLLFFLSLSARFKVVIVSYGISLVYAFLFLDKTKIKHVLFPFLIAIFLMFMASYFVKEHPRYLKDYYKYELSIYDRNDFVLDEIYTRNQSTISWVENLNKADIKLLAKAMFLLDEPSLDSISYQNILKHNSLSDYVFNNPEFNKIYLAKISSIFDKISQFRYVLIFNTIMFFVLLRFFNRRRKTLKYLILISAYLSIPLILSILFTFNNKILSVYLLIPIFFVLILPTSSIKSKFFLYLFLLLASFLNLEYNSKRLIKEKLNEEHIANMIYKACIEDKANSKTSYFAGFQNYFMPSNIFFVPDNSNIYFLDIMGYIDYPSIEYMNNLHFGENKNQILERYKIVEQNGYLYADEYMLAFLKTYFRNVYQIKLTFEPQEIYDNKLGKYKISISATN